MNCKLTKYIANIAIIIYIIFYKICCLYCSVTKSCLFPIPWKGAHQAFLSTISQICTNSCPLSQSYYLTIFLSVVPFYSCFILSQYQLSASGGQSTGAFFIVQISHLYLTTRKINALTIWTFVSQMMSLLFNTLSRFVIAILPRSKNL